MLAGAEPSPLDGPAINTIRTLAMDVVEKAASGHPGYGCVMDEDEFALRIEAFDEANDGGVGWYKDKGAYHLYLLATEAPIARLKPTGTDDEVRIAYWSHRRKWEDIEMEIAVLNRPASSSGEGAPPATSRYHLAGETGRCPREPAPMLLHE